MARKVGQTVLEAKGFEASVDGVLSEQEVADLIAYLSLNPTVGNEIKGTGGLRKVRVGAKGRGKRGGARVIYFYFNEKMPIALLAAFAKNEAADLTAAQRKKLSGVVDEIVKTFTKKGEKK